MLIMITVIIIILILITDSIHLAFERERSYWEKAEINLCLDTNTRLDFHDTIHASRQAEFYIKTFHEILDFSCLNEVRKKKQTNSICIIVSVITREASTSF